MIYLVDAHLPASAKEPLAHDKLWAINITHRQIAVSKSIKICTNLSGSVDRLKSYPTRSARMFAILSSKTSAANDPWYQDTQNV